MVAVRRKERGNGELIEGKKMVERERVSDESSEGTEIGKKQRSVLQKTKFKLNLKLKVHADKMRERVKNVRESKRGKRERDRERERPE